MGQMPRVVSRKIVEDKPDDRDCPISAKGFMCGHCRFTAVNPSGRGRCSNAKCKATIHVFIGDSELRRTEKPKKAGLNK